MWSGTFVAAHKRATFPVLGGISGSTSATFSMIDSCHSLATTKRNDELRLKVSSFLLQGPIGLRCLCAPVEGTYCDLLVRVISSLRLSWFRPSSRPSWFRPSSRLLSFHLF